MPKKQTFLIALIIMAHLANAHEVRPGLLQIEQTSENTFHVLWKIPATGMAVPKIYLGLPDNWSLQDRNANLIANSLRQEYEFNVEGAIHGGKISFDGLQSTIMDVLVTIKLLNGVQFTGLVKPEKAHFVIPDTPSIWSISKTYLILGFEHILLGIDHLLFVLALVLITFGKWRMSEGQVIMMVQ